MFVYYFLLLLKWNLEVIISLDVVLPCVSQTNDNAVMYTVNSCIKIQVLFKEPHCGQLESFETLMSFDR